MIETILKLINGMKKLAKPEMNMAGLVWLMLIIMEMV